MNTIISGPKNLITDVSGLRVGNVSDDVIKSGVTAIVCDVPTIGSVDIMGGSPGTRETDLLSEENLVEHVDGIVLAGGSAFGLDAASGAMAAFQEMGRGFKVGSHTVPIVPAAILNDLTTGGDKNWGRYPPYREFGYDAVYAAKEDFDLGTTGAGTGALAANCKGGLGSASTVLKFPGFPNVTIGALVAVNSSGSPLIGESGNFWAAPFELNREFGGLGVASPFPTNAHHLRIRQREKTQPGSNTTIAVIATDAVLTKAQAKRLAIAAHDGFARAIWPSHTPIDGDLIFSLATGNSDFAPKLEHQIDIYAHAASTMSRAIARAIYEATTADNDYYPAWQSKFGS